MLARLCSLVEHGPVDVPREPPRMPVEHKPIDILPRLCAPVKNDGIDVVPCASLRMPVEHGPVEVVPCHGTPVAHRAIDVLRDRLCTPVEHDPSAASLRLCTPAEQLSIKLALCLCMSVEHDPIDVMDA